MTQDISINKIKFDLSLAIKNKNINKLLLAFSDVCLICLVFGRRYVYLFELVVWLFIYRVVNKFIIQMYNFIFQMI